MPKNQMLTVRIPVKDLERLDELALIQGRPRSQIIQEALVQLINKSDELRSAESARIRKRLRPAIKEQCELLESAASFSDEHRVF